MVVDSQTKTIALILQGQRGTSTGQSGEEVLDKSIEF
jgi:hypothetical protein